MDGFVLCDNDVPQCSVKTHRTNPLHLFHMSGKCLERGRCLSVTLKMERVSGFFTASGSSTSDSMRFFLLLREQHLMFPPSSQE